MNGIMRIYRSVYVMGKNENSRKRRSERTLKIKRKQFVQENGRGKKQMDEEAEYSIALVPTTLYLSVLVYDACLFKRTCVRRLFI